MSRPPRPAAGAALPTALLALLLALPAAAQEGRPVPHSAWGGADSPGGLFGGDPREADLDRDQRITQDELWRWVRRRAEQADTDRDSRVTPQELGIGPQDRRRQAWFRAADADRSGHLTMDELQLFSGYAFRFHDTDRNGHLAGPEMRRAAPRNRPATPAAEPASPAPPR